MNINELYTGIKALVRIIKLNKKFTIVSDDELQLIIKDYPAMRREYAEFLEKEDVYSWYANEFEIANADRNKLINSLNFLNTELQRRIRLYNDTATDFFEKEDVESAYYNKGKKDVCQDIFFIVEDIIKRKTIS